MTVRASLVVVTLIGIVAASCASCAGSGDVALSPSPSVASSMPVEEFPAVGGVDVTSGSLDFETSARIVQVFLHDEAAPAAVAALGATIADMPEVAAYTHVSKDRALAEFREKLGDDADEILGNLQTNPIPASFRLLIRERDDVRRVARRFYDAAVVDNSPGTHDGVIFMSDDVYRMYGSPAP